MTVSPRATSTRGTEGTARSSVDGPARNRVWGSITATSGEIAELTRRLAELDADGDLPAAEQLARTGAPLRETKWRRLDEPELAALERPGTSANDDRVVLEPLRRGVHRRLEQLVRDLRELDGASELGEDSWLRIEQAMRIHFDERILERLPNYLRPSWSRLYEVSNNGGVDFYRYLDEDLDRTHPSLVFEIYYFCFRHDFVGRYANDPRVITQYLSDLEARIDFVVPDTVAAPAQEPTSLLRPWPVRRYYVVALSSALLVTLVLLWGSNRPPEPGSRSSSDPSRESDDRGQSVGDDPTHEPLCSKKGPTG